jgi:hypothetical protein
VRRLFISFFRSQSYPSVGECVGKDLINRDFLPLLDFAAQMMLDTSYSG